MNSIKIIPLFILISVTSKTFGLSEEDIVRLALEKSTDFKILRINRESDSLSLENEKADWLPSVDLSLSQGFSGNEDSDFPGSDSVDYVASYGGSANQRIPGGGEFSLGLDESVSSPIKNGDPNYTTSFSLDYTQPLLRDAWKFGSQDYDITIARLDQKEFSLRQKQDLINELSGVRQVFWSWYESSKVLDIYNGERELSRKRLVTERKRLVLGDATPLDTLSAAFEYLKAEQQCLSAEYNLSNIKKSVAKALAVGPDSIEMSADLIVEIFDPPPADKFIEMAEQFDPDLKIFETAQKRLEYELEYQKNQKLPSLDFTAGYGRITTGDSPFSSDNSLSSNNLVRFLLSYSLPTKKRNISYRQAEINVEKNILNMDQYKLDLEVELSDLVERWNKEKQELRIAAAAEQIAKKQLEASEAGYNIGTVDNLSYLKAQNDLTRAAVDKLQKEVALKKLEIIFDEMTGSVLSKFGVTFK